MNTFPATLLNSARLSRGKYVLKSNFINMIKCFFTDHSDEHRNSLDLKSGPTIKINWRIRDGSSVVSHAKVGDVLLRVAQSHGVELEGACEGVIWHFSHLSLIYYLRFFIDKDGISYSRYVHAPPAIQF